MKKFISLFICFTILLSSNLQAAFLPYDLLGEFAGDGAIRFKYQGKFGPLEAMLIEEDVLKNERFLCGVEDGAYAPLMFKKFKKVQTHNYRHDSVPDIPYNYVYYVLQRLYPSPDGIDLVPNNRSNDPLANLSAEAMGVILNFVRDYGQHIREENGAGAANNQTHLPDPSDHKIRELSAQLSMVINPIDPTRDVKKLRSYIKRNPGATLFDAIWQWRGKTKAFQIVHDFVVAVVYGLYEQHTNFELYRPYFLENVLFGFAMRKAAESANPRKEMLHFYKAMPGIIMDDWVYAMPFDRDTFDRASENINLCLTKEQIRFCMKTESVEVIRRAFAKASLYSDLGMTSRDYLAYFAGIREFSKAFPSLHVYTTARFMKTSFPNCGETALWNFLNLLLWSFEERRFRYELLEDGGAMVCLQGLYNFYHEFDTPEKQNTVKALQAWTNTVSGFVDNNGAPLRDIVYKNGNCNITDGVVSMCGVMAALFSPIMDELDSITDPFERSVSIFDKVLSIFTPHGENWTWKIKKRKQEEVHSIREKSGFTIQFFKDGENLPHSDVSDGDGSSSGSAEGSSSPQEEPIMWWNFSPGHYEVSTPSSNPDLSLLGLAGMRRFAESRSNILPHIDFHIISSCARLHKYPLWLVVPSDSLYESLIQRFPSDLEYPMYLAPPRDNEEKKVSLGLQLVPSLDFRSNLSIDAAGCILKTLTSQDDEQDERLVKVGRSVANAIAALPVGDPHATASLLDLGVNLDGSASEDIARFHPRVAEGIDRAFLAVQTDPDFAYECLMTEAAEIGGQTFLIRSIPEESLSRKQVRKLMTVFADDSDFTPGFWQEFFDRFGNVFREGDESQINPSLFLEYRKSPGSQKIIEMLIEDSSPETIEWFCGRGLLPPEAIQTVSQQVITSWLDRDSEDWDLQRIVDVAPIVGFTFSNFQNASLKFVELLIEDNYGRAAEVINVLQTLGATKEDILPVSNYVVMNGILGELLGFEKLELIDSIFSEFNITSDDVGFMSDHTYACNSGTKVIAHFSGARDTVTTIFPEEDHFEGTCLEFLRRIYPQLWEGVDED